MDFIFFIDRFPDLTKKSIDQGSIPTSAISLVNYFRSVFLLSNELRRENNILIYAINQFPESQESLIISIRGEKLRFLSPDERSTLFLFNNIIKIAQGNTHKKIDQRAIRQFAAGDFSLSTPGIRFKKGKITDVFEELSRIRLNSNIDESCRQKKHSFLVLMDHSKPDFSTVFLSDILTYIETKTKQQITINVKIEDIIPIIDQNSIILEVIGGSEEIHVLNENDKEHIFSFIQKNSYNLILQKNPVKDKKLFPWEQIILVQSLLDNKIDVKNSIEAIK